MDIWGWITQNAAPLWVVATVVASLAALLIKWKPWSYSPRSALLVTVEVAKSTLPPDLLDWMQDLIRAVDLSELKGEVDKASSAREGSSPTDGPEFGEWTSSPNASRLRRTNKINRATLKLTNRGDRSLKNVRIKLGEGHYHERFWIDLKGDYLTPRESQVFLQEIDWHQEDGVVLPPLPDIPASAKLEITYYGPLSVNAYHHWPEVEVSAAGIKADVKWMVPILERWYTTAYSRYLVLSNLFLGIAGIGVLILLVALVVRIFS